MDWRALNRRREVSLLKDLFHHDGNGWWKIPKTAEAESNPPSEHPFGGLINFTKNFITYITSGKGHAGPGYYWTIAGILAVITLIEVWWFDVEALKYLLVPAMLGFSLVKFILVVAFFMHLRFDNKMYSTVFVTCMIIGIIIFTLFLFLSAFHGFGN